MSDSFPGEGSYGVAGENRVNRLQRFVVSAGAGYVSTLANLIYTVVSVPLALHYLPKEEFALWALTVQIGGYLMLLDLGMSVSVSRFLADHKDSMQDGEYGKILRTGFWIFTVQAIGLAICGCGLALLLPGWLEIPPSLKGKFQVLTMGQSLILSLGLALRIKTTPLWAHQRTDITHLAVAANLLTSLGFMGLGFAGGWGVYSFLAGNLAGSVWTWFLPWAACARFNYLPNLQKAAGFDRGLFLRMLRFGRDALIMQLGGLLCTGSQIILITKLLGLEAAAVFSVATKTLTMGQQLVGRILESAAPGLTEMFVRGERERFGLRFYQMTSVSIALAAALGIFLVAANRGFVSVWTQGKVEWNYWGDLLIGGILISTVASRCFQGAFGMTGNLAKVCYLPFVEGMLFFVCTLALGGLGGVNGILGIVLLANILISMMGGGLLVARTVSGRFFWQNTISRLLAPYFLAAFFCWWTNGLFASPITQVIWSVGLVMISGLFLVKVLEPLSRMKT